MGMRFTDSYGEQSCTAGRSAFTTGQSVYRTGLSKVGMPAAPTGLQYQDPTIAELLQPRGVLHCWATDEDDPTVRERSEEHTSELQSLRHLVCRLLLEKKKQHNETDILR